MTAKEIILSMVEALENPSINIRMDTYGTYEIKPVKLLGFSLFKKRVCYGCAATNTIAKIGGTKFTPENIFSLSERADSLKTSFSFLEKFESAINSLRLGNIERYNLCAKDGGFATIKGNGWEPIELDDDYTKEQLDKFRHLAQIQ